MVLLKKKFNYFVLIITILVLIFSLAGCSFAIGNYKVDNLSVSKKKPNNFYYTNLLAKNLTLSSSCKAIVLDTNFYKEKDLVKEDVDTIKKFTKELNKQNFVDKPSDLPAKPIYKLYFTFDKEKYIINVYNERYLSIYPWDGNYPMDYIDMNSISPSNNINSLCKYLIPR